MKIKNLLLLSIVLKSILGFAQATDTFVFDFTVALDCTVNDFEKQYSLSFIGDNSSFYRAEYESTATDSGVSVRIYGQYEYVVVGFETFSPILIITKNAQSRNTKAETAAQFFVQLIGFAENGKVSGTHTATANLGKIKLDAPYCYIRIYNGRPMVNGDIYARYDFSLDEKDWLSWQPKFAQVTKITRARP
jgi:hypothetical protein